MEFRKNNEERLEKLIRQNEELIRQNEKQIEQNELMFQTLCVLSKTIIKLGEIMAEGFSLVNEELKKEGEQNDN